jgi:hypothetical protein
MMRSNPIIRYDRRCEFRAGVPLTLLDERWTSTRTVEIPAKAGIW